MLQFDWEVFGRCCLLTVAGGGQRRVDVKSGGDAVATTTALHVPSGRDNPALVNKGRVETDKGNTRLWIL